MNLRRLSPLPQGRVEVALWGVLLLSLAALFLTGCANGAGDSLLPATRDYAAQVARDNAANAPTNPFSAIIAGVSTLVASLAGAGILIKRGIKKYDDAPYEPEDVASIERAKALAEHDKAATP